MGKRLSIRLKLNGVAIPLESPKALEEVRLLLWNGCANPINLSYHVQGLDGS